MNQKQSVQPEDNLLEREQQQNPQLTTPREVVKILSKFPPNKAPGPDQVPNQALKEAPRRLSVYLSLLFNTILLTCHFPTSWKLATVCMIPKPGKNPLFPQNYRPITLLSTLSKVLEKILHARLHHHVETNSLLPPHQFGIRRHYDTQLQLVRVVDQLTTGFNDFAHTIGIFLDVEKAFDRVWHKGLFTKLHLLQIPDTYVHLLHSYLRVDNSKSATTEQGQEPKLSELECPREVSSHRCYTHSTLRIYQSPRHASWQPLQTTLLYS